VGVVTDPVALLEPSDEQLALAAALGKERRVEAGDALFTVDATATTGKVLHSGRI
jgi:hypothetical protein